jgi:hypothetical protein
MSVRVCTIQRFSVAWTGYGVRGLVPALGVVGKERRRRETTKAAPGRSTPKAVSLFTAHAEEYHWEREAGGV